MSEYLCRLCGSKDFVTIYEGPVRDGGADANSVEGFSVQECQECGMASLMPLPTGLAEFYESHEYREKFDRDISPSGIHEVYDHEQSERIKRIGVENLRGQVVADFGCSAGVFLDAVKGIAKRTIAVEPASIFKDYLLSMGHEYFTYPRDLIDSGVKADIVVSFDVIEHLEDPLAFLCDVHEVLQPGGRFVLSMPSADDLLNKIAPSTFRPFFYQTAHINYFNRKSLGALFDASPFEKVDIDYLHKYKIDNFVQWLDLGVPGKRNLGDLFDRGFNNIYQSEIERLGISSHFFISAFKE